jgi:hypothetical protein
MRQQLEAFDWPAVASSAESDDDSIAAASVAMVQPCTVIVVSLGIYTFMVLSDRLQDAAAATELSTAAATGSSVVASVASCVQQLLLDHSHELQQQIELSQLPGLLETASTAAAASPAGIHAQQQQQQQQQQQCNDQLPQLRLAVPCRHASFISDTDSGTPAAPSPSIAQRLQQLLLCGNVGQEAAVSAGTVRDLLSPSGQSSPASKRDTELFSIPHRSYIFSNPGTPTAAEAAKTIYGSSSSSPFKSLRILLLGKGLRQQGFRFQQETALGLRNGCSSSLCSAGGGLPGSPKTKAAGRYGCSSGSSTGSSRLSSTAEAGRGFNTDTKAALSASGVHRNGSHEQQAVFDAAAGGWCVVQGSHGAAGHLRGVGKGRSTAASTSSNSGTGAKLKSSGCCSAEAAAAAAAGAVELAVDWQQGIFALAAPHTAGKLSVALDSCWSDTCCG